MERKASSSHILYGPLKDAVESMIKDVLAPVRAQAGIFIYLDADFWRVKFLGVSGGEPDRVAAEQLNLLLEPVREQYGQANDEHHHQRLFELVFDLKNRSGLSVERMRGAAVYWLTTGSLSLGDTVMTAKGQERIPHWFQEGEPRSPLRFQDTLEWAATYQRDLESMESVRKDIGRYEQINRTTLKIPNSAARKNLITGENLEIFLAQHIIALDREALEHTPVKRKLPQPSLTSFFMPIRGFGQWRAAIDWIQCETGEENSTHNHGLEKKLKEQTSELSKSALEELLTLTLINIFAHTARKALAPFTLGVKDQREKLRNAFALLWWSQEISIYKQGDCIERLGRDARSGALVATGRYLQSDGQAQAAWKCINNAHYQGFFSYDEKRHPEATAIRIKIDPVIARVTDDEQVRARLKNDCPFDEVRYRTYLFDANEEEIKRFADQLGERLEEIVREQNLRRITHEQAQYTVYEDIGHILNATLSLAGLNDVRKTLRTDLRALVEELPSLRKISNSLTLLTIMEGTVGLLRLIGILHRGDYSKLEEWFDEASLALWESRDEKTEKKVFQLYQEAIVHLARAMGSAFGRPWFAVTVEGQTTFYDEACHLDPGKLTFLPLSKSRRSEAIYALLPALVEPLRNALLFLEDREDYIPAREPIRLTIKDNRRKPAMGTPHILVEVANLYPSDLPSNMVVAGRDPAGVRATRRFMDLTGMAHIRRTSYKDEYRTLAILLHPQKLREKILKTNNPTDI